MDFSLLEYFFNVTCIFFSILRKARAFPKQIPSSTILLKPFWFPSASL